jgi:hypothetical protein
MTTRMTTGQDDTVVWDRNGKKGRFEKECRCVPKITFYHTPVTAIYAN